MTAILFSLLVNGMFMIFICFTFIGLICGFVKLIEKVFKRGNA